MPGKRRRTSPAPWRSTPKTPCGPPAANPEAWQKAQSEASREVMEDTRFEAIAVLRRTQPQVLCGVVDPLPVDRHDDVTAPQAEAFRTNREDVQNHTVLGRGGELRERRRGEAFGEDVLEEPFRTITQRGITGSLRLA